MAKHLPPKKRMNINVADIKLPKLKLPVLKEMPAERESVWRGIQNRRTVDAVFSLDAVLPLLAAILIYAAALFTKPQGIVRLAIYLVPGLMTAAPAAFRILVAALNKQLRERDTLIVVAVAGAFCLGKYEAGALAAIVYRVCELMEGLAVYTGKDALSKLKERMPAKADVEVASGVSRRSPMQITVGEIISVMPGEAVPVDCVIIEGMSALDCSLLTGSSTPLTVTVGDEIMSGCLNLTNTIRVKALHRAENSTAERLMETVELASANRAERERSVSRLTGATSLGIFALGLLVGIIPPLFNGQWVKHLNSGLALVILALPTGMLVSIPLTYLGGVLRCAYKGIFIKGNKFIESLAKTQTMVFEKTGTVTEKDCVITEVCPRGVTEQELLDIAALAECHSEHPVARALRAVSNMGRDTDGVQTEETESRGVSAVAGGRHICVGNAMFMNEHGISCDSPQHKGVPIHVAADKRYLGYFLVLNKAKEDAFDALEAIRHSGVKNTVMLTGDLHSAARPIASSLNFDMVKTELTKDGKLTALEYLMAAKPERSALTFVSDGDRAAELYARVDVGVLIDAMNSRAAAEDADVIIMDSDIKALAEAVDICRRTDMMAQLNMTATLVMRGTGVILCLVGILPPMAAVIIEAAAMIFTLVNTLRVYVGLQIKRKKKKK